MTYSNPEPHKQTAKKVSDVLEKIVGKGNVSVQVNADIDFNSAKEAKEFIDEIKCNMKSDSQENGALYLLNKINFDCFSISVFLPEQQSGFAVIFKVPGLNEFITNCT